MNVLFARTRTQEVSACRFGMEELRQHRIMADTGKFGSQLTMLFQSLIDKPGSQKANPRTSFVADIN